MSEHEANDQKQVAAQASEHQLEDLPQPEVTQDQAEQAKGGRTLITDE